MAIAAVATNTLAQGNRSNSGITKPAGTASGDAVYLHLYVGNSTFASPVSVTPPSGFTLINAGTLFTGNASPDNYILKLYVYRKIAGGSEPATYTFTHSAADTEGFAKTWSGVDNTTPEDMAVVENSSLNQGTSQAQTTTINPGTTATNGAQVVVCEVCWDSVGAGSYSGTTPTLTTELTGTGLKVASGNLATAGAVGSRTRTNGNSSVNSNIGWVAVAYAIRPAGAGSVSVTLGATEAPDVAAISLQQTWNVTLGATEAKDVAAISLQQTWNVTLGATEAPDVAAIALAVGGSVTLAATEAPDVAAISLTQSWNVTLGATEAQDVAAVSLGYTAPGSSITLAATEAQDTAAISLSQSWNVTLGATEAPDVVAISLQASSPVSVTLAATEAPDIAGFVLTSPSTGFVSSGTSWNSNWNKAKLGLPKKKKTEEEAENEALDAAFAPSSMIELADATDPARIRADEEAILLLLLAM